MTDAELLIWCIKITLPLLVIWAIWNGLHRRRRSKKAIKSTNEWCDVSEKFREWEISNPGKSSSHPEFQTIIKEEIEAYRAFIKYHPHCDDDGKYLKCLNALLTS